MKSPWQTIGPTVMPALLGGLFMLIILWVSVLRDVPDRAEIKEMMATELKSYPEWTKVRGIVEASQASTNRRLNDLDESIRLVREVQIEILTNQRQVLATLERNARMNDRKEQ